MLQHVRDRHNLASSVIYHQTLLEACSVEGMDGVYLASFALDSYVKPLRSMGRQDVSACPYG
jgi:hypothetical protein